MRNTWDSSVGRAEDSKSLCTSSNLVPSGIVGIAQLVEQRTENPRVTSSNLVPGREKKDLPNRY